MNLRQKFPPPFITVICGHLFQFSLKENIGFESRSESLKEIFIAIHLV